MSINKLAIYQKLKISNPEDYLIYSSKFLYANFDEFYLANLLQELRNYLYQKQFLPVKFWDFIQQNISIQVLGLKPELEFSLKNIPIGTIREFLRYEKQLDWSKHDLLAVRVRFLLLLLFFDEQPDFWNEVTMAEKSYSPIASYEELRRVGGLIDGAQTLAELRKIIVTDGPKIGYKAFSYLLSGKMTAEAMKPDEACVVATTFELQGKFAKCIEIYKKILAVYPNHLIAKSKVITQEQNLELLRKNTQPVSSELAEVPELAMTPTLGEIESPPIVASEIAKVPELTQLSIIAETSEVYEESPQPQSQQYHKWNQAILKFVLDGLQPGSAVFLTIDDETLVNVANFMKNPLHVEERVQNFIEAVQYQCVQGGHLLLGLVEPKAHDLDNPPPYLAFLAAMVLAAYRMDEDENTEQTDYYSRLNNILGLPDKGRPEGLHDEVGFWQHWASWLTRHGYLPSAKGGSGAYKYIGYPISQTLLRNTDKDSLWRHFSSRNWPKNLAEKTVIQRINQDKYLTSRLRQALQNRQKDAIYAEGLNQAIVTEYNLWGNSDALFSHDKPFSRSNLLQNLTMGLYRRVDFFTGQSQYWLHVPQSRHIQGHNFSVMYSDKKYNLVPERTGWFEPLEIATTLTMLTHGLAVNLNDSLVIKRLVLPARDFWLLTAAPEDFETGNYATWGKPELGTPFVLLCKRSLQSELNHLKQEGLINWQHIPKELGSDWLEYPDMMVVSQGWVGVSIQHQDLYNSLQPQSSLGVGLQGGIRLPQCKSWLVGYGPELVIHSFHTKAKVIISGVIQTTLEEITTNHPTAIDWQKYPVGIYTLTAYAGPDEKQLTINLVDWTDLEMETVLLSTQATPFGEVFGAFVNLAHQ